MSCLKVFFFCFFFFSISKSLHLQRFIIRSRYNKVIKSSKQDWDRPDYTPQSSAPGRADGNGEWEDWLGNESFIGEDTDYGSEDDDDISHNQDINPINSSASTSNTAKTFSEWKSNSGEATSDGWDNLLKTPGGGGGKSASENWSGWSEEAPYFDDNDILDEEPERGPPMPKLGSSDLWSRPNQSIPLEGISAVQYPNAKALIPAIEAVSDARSSTTVLTALEIKVDGLMREVSSLKTLAALLLGLVLGRELGDDHGMF